MARPRKKHRDYLPENLYVQVRGGRDYFTYRNPLTGKSVSIGYDCALALDYAIKANRGIDVDFRRPEHAENGMLEYQEIISRAQDSIKRPGIYFLLQADDLVYIGKSADVEHRLGQHRNRGKIPFDRVAIVWCGMSELSKLEAQYIRKFRPFYNAVAPLGTDEEEREL